ncbi:sulfur carrier protein ThiS [Priestia filamentosa]|uniref:Thiamine biosynthesis protein ThiS n=1 Tax=Priestia filamentosa TaxID=1402861 RepID=A0A1X7FH19_9BACI|nr:sulfur carrier protein ThiS [Priestia filamentosa]AKO91227.1 thiamine biosynthesis protein ThiS [Priestia filamentosa]MDT3765327.1 sulfur carrier protein ThiS [Priestia filamentosa]OXS67098.1 thiamine biosynthesis protein ThiS [Priestia filamentosa]RJS65402.1 thiamine biosynthesis protein ThiS [Priestia filamentosa]WCM16391.1 sulfur carrier protein ThiS [Priestia filamentosa]
MNCKINGENIKVEPHISNVYELLAAYGMENKILVVEKNGTILEKEEHINENIQDGDTFEIVSFVGGG